MRPRWLIVGAVHGLGLHEWNEARNQLELIGGYERAAQEEGDELAVIGYRQERQAIVGKFLEDPGYADEDFVCEIQSRAPDIFTPHMLEQYFVLRWPKHLALLASNTMVHIVTFALIGLELGLLGSGALHMLPTWLAAILLWTTIAAIYLDFAWCPGISKVVRHSLLSGRKVNEVEVGDQLRFAAAGFRSWRKPLAWAVAWVMRAYYRRHTRSTEPDEPAVGLRESQ
jgi:hypothetical protein